MADGHTRQESGEKGDGRPNAEGSRLVTDQTSVPLQTYTGSETSPSPGPTASWHDTTGSSEGVWDRSWDGAESGTLVERVRWAKYDSRDNVDFYLSRVPRLFIPASVSCFFPLIIMALIELVFVVVGVSFFNECPREPRISLYLTVAGIIGVLVAVIAICRQIYYYQTGVDVSETTIVPAWVFRVLEMSTMTFMLLWFFLGSYWVFNNFQSYSHEMASPDFCNSNVYGFAFVVCTMQYVLLTVVTVLYCTVCWISCYCV